MSPVATIIGIWAVPCGLKAACLSAPFFLFITISTIIRVSVKIVADGGFIQPCVCAMHRPASVCETWQGTQRVTIWPHRLSDATRPHRLQPRWVGRQIMALVLVVLPPRHSLKGAALKGRERESRACRWLVARAVPALTSMVWSQRLRL